MFQLNMVVTFFHQNTGLIYQPTQWCQNSEEHKMNTNLKLYSPLHMYLIF